MCDNDCWCLTCPCCYLALKIKNAFDQKMLPPLLHQFLGICLQLIRYQMSRGNFTMAALYQLDRAFTATHLGVMCIRGIQDAGQRLCVQRRLSSGACRRHAHRAVLCTASDKLWKRYLKETEYSADVSVQLNSQLVLPLKIAKSIPSRNANNGPTATN